VNVASGAFGTPFNVDTALSTTGLVLFNPVLSPGGTDLFFDVYGASQPLYVLNTHTGALYHPSGLANDPGSSSYSWPAVEFAPNNPDAFVVVPGTDDLYSLSLASPPSASSVALSASLGGSSYVALSPDGSTLYGLVQSGGAASVVPYPPAKGTASMRS
jgi:hypothetical protein